MAIDAFMVFPKQSKSHTVFAKKIVGESLDAEAVGQGEMRGAFEIDSFTWGASAQSGESSKPVDVNDMARRCGIDPAKAAQFAALIAPAGGGRMSENTMHRSVTVKEFSINKVFETASLGLFQACIDVECVFEKAIVLFRKAGAGKPFDFAKFEFGNVRVDSIDWNFADEGETEGVTFSFEKCELFYFPQGSTGEKEKAAGLKAGVNRMKSASYSQAQDG